jgi:hypothetical protein
MDGEKASTALFLDPFAYIRLSPVVEPTSIPAAPASRETRNAQTPVSPETTMLRSWLN